MTYLYSCVHLSLVERYGSVGITTRYGLCGPGIRNYVWGEIFLTGPDLPRCPHIVLYDGYRFIPAVKRLGRGDDQPPPSSLDAKQSVGLYLTSPHAFIAGYSMKFTFYVSQSTFKIEYIFYLIVDICVLRILIHLPR